MNSYNASYESRSKLKLKVKYYITFPVCNLLTRAMSPVRLVCGKPDSPRFSYALLTLDTILIRFRDNLTMFIQMKICAKI
ncbi:Uncharacterized protein NV38_0003591 [Leptospira kirschneri serovar Mozdok]|uniref:hypothetical protein n=1 Tax=Leptospira kirschneri TaxID=29507 RepID=UPI000531290D|nr:hypothetical protein [Leptospira kirschneri]KON75765.1 Uncharacterized protein NV38_0003591 [Leptospira kirschneri serovar Mozdok]NDK06570.1 hypothetical protein [Leptospira kirschneri serovar Mozdok]